MGWSKHSLLEGPSASPHSIQQTDIKFQHCTTRNSSPVINPWKLINHCAIFKCHNKATTFTLFPWDERTNIYHNLEWFLNGAMLENSIPAHRSRPHTIFLSNMHKCTSWPPQGADTKQGHLPDKENRITYSLGNYMRAHSTRKGRSASPRHTFSSPLLCWL